ncbi:MAG: sigma-70 family RNA polymerase sigma factor [Planctomycetota bacterium]|nr:sigma-70 family RNA polymerase sigma factor [Planctomycetota bacterium]
MTPRTTTEASFPRLLAAARAGDGRAQESLFRRYYAQVERIAHAQLRRGLGRRRPQMLARFSTADVVQEVFRSLLGNLSTLRGTTEGEFVTFVTRVVRSRVQDAIRHHSADRRDYRRSQASLPGAGLGELPSRPAPERPGSTMDGLLERQEAALASLSPLERGLFRARIERGARFEELAREFGYTSRYAARRAYFAAQAKLAVRLGPSPLEPAVG